MSDTKPTLIFSKEYAQEAERFFGPSVRILESKPFAISDKAWTEYQESMRIITLAKDEES